MSGDALHALQGLDQRIEDLKETSTRLVSLRDQIMADLIAKREEIDTLDKKVELLAKVGELFRALMDLLVVKQVRAVEGVVTEGLGTIFHDLDLTFEALVGPRYNKIAVDFFFRQGIDPARQIRGRPLEAFGGGPSSVADLVLRILTILRLKRWPLLILDETLGPVSDEYVDGTGRFLKQLAESLAVDILLVTHKPSYLDHSNVSYRCAEVVTGEIRHLDLRSA